MTNEVEAVGFLWKATLWTMGGLGTTIALLLGRSVKRLDDDMRKNSTRLDEHDKQHAHCTLELSQFKTHVSDTYSKDASVQASLARIHDRMDEGFTELRNDIKHLIGGKK